MSSPGGEATTAAPTASLTQQRSVEAAAAGLQRARTQTSAATSGGARLERTFTVGTVMQHMQSGALQQAGSLPTDKEVLRHACTMPGLHDVAAPRLFGLLTLKQLVGLGLGVALFILFVAGRFVTTYSKANDMLAITVLMACLWAFEVIPIYVTSLLPVVLLPLMAVTSTEIVSEAYFNEIQLLYIGMFMVNIAMEEVGLPKRAALLLLRRMGGSRPGVVLVVFMLLSWFLSMLTNSIVTALMITPLAVRFLNGAHEAIMAAEGEEGDSSDGRSFLRFCDGLLLGIAFSSACGGLATITGTPANGVLAGEEFLGGAVTFGKWFIYAAPVSCIMEIIVIIVVYLRYAWGTKIKLSSEVLDTEHELMLREIGEFSRDEVLVGLLLFLMLVLLIICPFAIAPYVTPGYGIELVSGASISCLCSLFLFLIPSKVRTNESLLTWKMAHGKLDIGVLLLIGGGFALASGFVQSGFSDVLGQWLGSCLIPQVEPFLQILVVVALVGALVQIFSNAATAAIVLQVLGAASLDAVVDPLPLMLPATLACSFAFMLPTAHPANVVVLALSSELPRPLAVREFLRTGSILVLIAVVVATVYSYYVEGSIFDLGPLPQYVCESPAAFCCWLSDVPGEVQGQWVTGQACVQQDATGGETCKLWNGTRLSSSRCRPFT